MGIEHLSAGSLLVQPGLLQLLVAFFFGVLTSLTPCVYPLIPVTVAIFGAHGDISRKRAFWLSATYVGGIALTYTVLGIISVKTGAVFGSLLGNTFVIVVVSALLIFLSLITLEIVHLELGHTLRSKAGRIGGKGFYGAFLMGIVSGVVAAPCVGPVLVVILVAAAASQSAFWGATLLFVYSLGIGMLFLLIGTFSGLFHKLPRSGIWLYGVKFLIATTLLMVVWFMLEPLLPPWEQDLANLPAYWWFLTAAIVLAGIGGRVAYRYNLKSTKVFAALILSFSLYQFLIPQGAHLTAAYYDTGLKWIDNSREALALGRAENKIVMLDLYAEWCVACKELDALTLSHPTVVPHLNRLITARVDYTAEEELVATYKIVGLPCVLFVRPDGREIPDSRIVGFMGPEEFLENLRKITAPSATHPDTPPLT